MQSYEGEGERGAIGVFGFQQKKARGTWTAVIPDFQAGLGS